MKRIIAILFLLSLLVQHFNKLVVIVDYYLNKNYISINLCVNKEKPRMQCAGKCYLKKKLNQEDTPDKNQATNNLKKTAPEIPFIYTAGRLDLSAVAGEALTAFTRYNDLSTFSFTASIFRPPSMA